MKLNRRIAAMLLAFTVAFSAVFSGCGDKKPNPEGGSSVADADYPVVMFGEKIQSSGMSYKLSGEKKLDTGEILGREYSKVDDDATLSFKLDEKYVKELSGKPLFIKLEYYESSSKSYKIEYKGKDGKVEESYEMASTTTWGGRSIRVDSIKLEADADSHFSLSLDTANSLWLRSVSVIENTAEQGTYPKLLKTDYKTSNGKVIEANVKDYGALGDGKTDDSLAFQTALRDMSEKGGTLYVPAGTYKLTQDMVIPAGVTVLGDFNEPSRENPKAGGTILAAYVPTVADGNTKLFMNMRHGSCVKGLTIWYPEQTLASGEAEPYNYTIGISQNIGVTIEDIYLVNSYKGITHASLDSAHYQQMVKNVYGTPLHTGYMAGHASDSDRQQIFDFSPKYWLGSGLENVPEENVLKTWLLTYGVGFSLGDIDFHYVADISIEGYKIGMHVRKFYGRIYNFNITDCNVCVYIESTVLYGGQLTKGVLKANGGENPVALLIGEGAENGFSGTMLDISSTGKYAVSHMGNAAMAITDSKISVTGEGSLAPLYVSDGRVSIMNTEFDGGSNHIILGEGVEKSSVLNCSSDSGELKVDNAAGDMLTLASSEENMGAVLDAEALAAADAQRAYQQKEPAKQELYNIADYGIPEGEQPEIGEALQKAIDDAAANGGGIVYITGGVYRLETPITVKSGVEVRGISDYFHYIFASIPSTAILTDYGKGGAKEPLIKLEENSGVRGLSVIYDKVAQETIQVYTPTVQATGKDCYTINTTIVGAWDAVDYNTYKCDNHYIESVNFFAFNKGIAIGGGSDGGVLLNGHSNPGEMWSTGYNKSEWSSDWEGPLNKHQHENAINFYYGECTNQVTFMTATFGAKRGIMVDGADIMIIGHGTDYSVNDIYITGDSNVTIIDPQCIGSYQTEPYTSTAVVCDSRFTGTAAIYNICPWNINDTAIRIDNGTLSVNGGYFLHSGDSPIIATGGNITMRGVIVKNRSLADIQASAGVKSVKAYGNIIYGTPKFIIDPSVKTYGTDLEGSIG